MKNVTVFCGSHPTGLNGEAYKQMALHFGQLLAQNEFVCVNGGTTGLMEEVSRGAIEEGGEVISIALHNDDMPIANSFYTKQERFDSLIPRQQRLIELGDFYVALPGGIGTMFEILEIVSKMGLREINQTFPLICIGEYYRPFQELMRHVDEEGFAWMNIEQSLLFVPSAEEAIVELKKMRSENA